MVNKTLEKMGVRFDSTYEADAKGGGPSTAPEKMLRAMLVQMFYSILSEGELLEQAQFNLRYRWFVGLAMDDAVWVPSMLTKNRERSLAHVAIELFSDAMQSAEKHGWLEGEHFSVDGILLRPGQTA